MKTLNHNIEFWEPKQVFKPGLYNVACKEKQLMDEMSEKEQTDLLEHLLSFSKAKKGLYHLRRYFDKNADLLKTFCQCNFSELDNVMDITPTRLNFEQVRCEHKGKGTCPFKGEGIVCIKGQ